MRAGEPLDSSAPFPRLALATIDHGRLELPDWLAGRWGVLLFYRAHW